MSGEIFEAFWHPSWQGNFGTFVRVLVTSMAGNFPKDQHPLRAQ